MSDIDLSTGIINDSIINTDSTLNTTKPQKSGLGVGRIILIVVLVILIIVSIIFTIIFRNNLNTAESNENPACPQLNCNLSDPNYVADPTCGASAFRFNSSGKKICSNNRYA
jgi:hypothetical protein